MLGQDDHIGSTLNYATFKTR